MPPGPTGLVSGKKKQEYQGLQQNSRDASSAFEALHKDWMTGLGHDDRFLLSDKH